VFRNVDGRERRNPDEPRGRESPPGDRRRIHARTLITIALVHDNHPQTRNGDSAEPPFAMVLSIRSRNRSNRTTPS
jgi:hypothetical protein